jgi:adenylosuccinate synthase
LEDAIGEELRKTGNEFGATTGRSRRCGWIDLVALKFACMVNGVTKIVMTKADVLDAFQELKVCTAYSIGGQTITEVPFQMSRLKIEPELKSFPGWKSDITSLKNYDNLPQKMKEYVQFIDHFLGVKCAYISNGPGRDQLIENL